VGALLGPGDEGAHPVGPAINWNESRYVDFWDSTTRVGGWFRIGNRPNAGWAEMSACVYLPDGTTAFMFDRATITDNSLKAGDQSWEVVDEWTTSRMRYVGPMMILADPWLLTNPKRAFTESPRTAADVDLECRSTGLATVLGSDQDHVDRIFLPGQTDFHYQHLAHVTGTVRIGDTTHAVDGRGGKDHSWGPRNWHAKRWLRWLIAGIDDDNGFMLTRAVGPTKQTRSGFVLADGQFHLVDDFVMRNVYAGEPNHEVIGVEVTIRTPAQPGTGAGLTVTATGTPRGWLPLRHRQANESGGEAILRIVKSPTDWTVDGRPAAGMLEYHDLVEDGRPIGLHE
jgi:hypothetical protein